MKKGLTEILEVRTNPDKTICMSIVEKESDLGISFNKRLFILIKNDRFGYISNFKQSDKPEDVDISKCKALIENKRISSDAERNKQVISINFTVLEDKKKVAKKWVLKMSTEELAKQWEKVINEERQKRSTSRNQSAVRSPKNRNQQKERSEVPLPENDGSKLTRPRQQLKKDFTKQKSQIPIQKQQYKNALYQTQNKKQFILSPEQNRNPPNISKRLEYSEENKAIKSKVAEEKNQDAEKLKRQREELARKEKELKDLEQRIYQDKKKIEEEKKLFLEEKKKEESKIKSDRNEPIKKSEQASKIQYQQLNQKEMINQNYNPKIEEKTKNEEVSKQKQATAMNQKFSQQEKPQPVKQSYVKKVEPNANKPKPKLEEINYSKFVQDILFQKAKQQYLPDDPKPVVGASPSPASKNRKLEEIHDNLLKQEQLKLNSKQKEPQKIELNKSDNLPLEFGWTFRYLIKEAEGMEEQIVEQFNYFCSSILKEVVAEFHLSEKKRVYLPRFRKQQYFLYEKDDIEFKVAFIGLKEVYNTQEPTHPDNICDQRSIKMLEKQFKNYQLLHRAEKEVKARHFRTPLTCLCEYEGFVAFFKARSRFDTQTSPTLDNKVQNDLQLISERTKILGSVLKSKQSLLILKLNNRFYRELAAQIGNAQANFDYFLVEQIKYLMPPDALFARQGSDHKLKREPEDNIQNVHFLRSELLANYSQNKEDMSQTILGTFKKTQKVTKNPNQELQKLSQNIFIPMAQLIKELDSLDFCFVHPKQLEDKMHEMGINMRYLGMLYEGCKLKFIKSFIMSEMAARVARALFRKTIQDYHMKQSNFEQNRFENSVRVQIIDFLNWVLGSSSETATIWKVLSIHSIDYFNKALEIEEVQKGYFVRSLIFHCGIEVDWSKITISKAFVSNQFFDDDNLTEVKVKIKGYTPVLNEDQKEIVYKMLEQDPTVFKFLEDEYSIQSKTLPLKFRHHQYFDIFRKYLSNFIPPDGAIHRGYKLLNLYNNQHKDLTHCQFSLRLMELKWHLKRQRKQKYINVFSEINQVITTNYGDFHPLLSDLYEIMSIYHRNNGEFEDAITFSKSSVINMLKVCGANHQRVGQCYYQMALCCIKGGKKQQAIISLKKAKNIFEANERQYDISYAHVCLKLGLLFLTQANTSEAENIVKFALSLFNRHLGDNLKNHHEQTYEEQRVQCFEILSRCYELNDSANFQKQLSLECQKEIRHINSPTNFEKLLKIVLCPILSTLKPSDASTYIDVISQIPLEISVNTYMQGYERLKMRVEEDGLVENLEKYTENIKSIEAFMKQNNSLEAWQGLGEVYERETVNDFISLTEELIYFLGEGFVTGTIRDSL